MRWSHSKRRQGEAVPREGLVHPELAEPPRCDPVSVAQESADLGRGDERHAGGSHEAGHVLDVIEVAVGHETQIGIGEDGGARVGSAEGIRPVRVEDELPAAGRGDCEAGPAVVGELHRP